VKLKLGAVEEEDLPLIPKNWLDAELLAWNSSCNPTTRDRLMLTFKGFSELRIQRTDPADFPANLLFGKAAVTVF
jgi:hypothetical protein